MEFVYVSNNEEIRCFLEKETKRKAVFIPISLLDDECLHSLRGLSVDRFVFVMFEDKAETNENKAFLARKNVMARYYSSSIGEYVPDEDIYENIDTIEKYIVYLKKQLPIIENTLSDVGDEAFKIAYDLKCGNCGHSLGYEDKYCKKCGTRRGEGRFSPMRSSYDCLYGSPDILRYKCPKCGKTWFWGSYSKDDDPSYCVNCGTLGEEVKRKRSDLYEWFEVNTEEELEEWFDKD